MSNNIFERSKVDTDFSVSTLDMASAVRDGRYTIMSEPGFSATSSAGSMFVKQTEKQSGGFKEGDIKSISSIDGTELRKLFEKGQSEGKISAPGSISDLVNKINTMSETQTKQAGGTIDDNDEEGHHFDEDGHDANEDDLDLDEMTGGRGNKEMLDSMAKLTKHIASKAGIKFPQAMKVSKHYREEAKKTNPSGSIIELNKEAMKIVDKDASSGKIESVVKRITGAAPSRSKRRKTSKKKAKGRKRGGFSPSASSVDDDSSDLSFITTSDE